VPDYDFRTQRLFVEADLAGGIALEPDRAQANYLLNVLRLRDGASILLFNGRHGEWVAKVAVQGRKSCRLIVAEQVRQQTDTPTVRLLFAPLKQARLEYLVQKAVEMGVGDIQPVLTQRTQMRKSNGAKMRAYAIEACEQCGILSVPRLQAPTPLEEAVAALPEGTHLIFCDENAPIQDPITALKTLPENGTCAIVIGPEGGFTEAERAMLMDHPRTLRIALGPRILRADTAAVAALAVVQAVLGDWAAERGG